MSDAHLWVTAPVEGLSSEDVKGYTIPDYIRASVQKWGWGEEIAFESAETGRKLTYNQVLKDSRAFATGLLQQGLQRQDVVAVILPNVPDYASILFGIWEAGLVVTPVNPACILQDISRQIEVSNSKIIVTLSQLLPLAQSIQRGNVNIKKIITVGAAAAAATGDDANDESLNYFDMLQTHRGDGRGDDGANLFTGSQMTTENDVALLPFSSGTSGLPKGVMLTHFALLSNAFLTNHPSVNRAKLFYGENSSQERYFAILPIFHIFGLISTLSCMLLGVHHLTFATFKPPLFIQKLREFKPTLLYLVPTLVSFIAGTDVITSQDLDQVHYITSGAAPAGEVLVKRLLDKAKNATFVEGYGLTEASAILTLCRFQKIGSIGQPHPEMVIKIVDTSTGVTLGQGEQGELCAKSPSLMKGYLNNEEATRGCIDSEGWFHTGDVGYYDEEGCFFIVDRLKELIKVKGFQVAPSELEEVIRSHGKVADVGVVGIPDDISGEVPRAFVVLKAGQEVVTEKEIVDFVNAQVSKYKYLGGGVQFVSEIPKGAAGKILRRVLKEKYCI